MKNIDQIINEKRYKYERKYGLKFEYLPQESQSFLSKVKCLTVYKSLGKYGYFQRPEFEGLL